MYPFPPLLPFTSIYNLYNNPISPTQCKPHSPYHIWAAVHVGCETPVHGGGWGTRTLCRCQSSPSCFEPRGAATSADSHRTKSPCWSAWWENQQTQPVYWIWATVPWLHLFNTRLSQQTFRHVITRKTQMQLLKLMVSFIYVCQLQHTGIVHDIGNVISYTCAFYATVSKYLQWKQPITSLTCASVPLCRWKLAYFL